MWFLWRKKNFVKKKVEKHNRICRRAVLNLWKVLFHFDLLPIPLSRRLFDFFFFFIFSYYRIVRLSKRVCMCSRQQLFFSFWNGLYLMMEQLWNRCLDSSEFFNGNMFEFREREFGVCERVDDPVSLYLQNSLYASILNKSYLILGHIAEAICSLLASLMKPMAV